jgi:uncharacterized protein YegL
MSDGLDLQQLEGEEPENYEDRCLCVLALDTSSSMSGAKINELNDGLRALYDAVVGDPNNPLDPVAASRLEVSIVTFDSRVTTVQDPELIKNVQMPVLRASGSTKLVDGVRAAIRKTRERKDYYRSVGLNYYRPYVVLITDGAPDGGQDVDGLAREIREGVENKHFLFWPIGVDSADMEMLGRIASRDTSPKMLKGTSFVKFFQWLSASMSTIAKSKQGQVANFPSTDGWAQQVV